MPMTEFREQDLTGARFERVSLRGSSFTQVYLNDARMHDVDLTGAHVRAAMLSGGQFRGVELVDVEISGELRNVVVNGVDIAPLVEAELNRRMPERARMAPHDSDGFREAWAILERLWEGTVARARTFPEEALHRSVDDEWSFIQTLRHLNFASACWVNRMILGDVSPWHPLDLPWDEAPCACRIPVHVMRRLNIRGGCHRVDHGVGCGSGQVRRVRGAHAAALQRAGCGGCGVRYRTARTHPER